MEEKRKYIRVPGDKFKIVLKSYKGEINFNIDELYNISAGGLLLHHDEEKKIGDHYLLDIISFDENIELPIKCLSKVHRVEENDNGFDIALEFEWVSKEDISRLNSLIENVEK